MRIRIIESIRERPYNTNQLSERLGVDYKTIQHHLRVLASNRILIPSGQGYGTQYLLSPDMEESLPEFDQILLRMDPTPRRPDREEQMDTA